MGARTITPNPDDPIDLAVQEFQKGVRREENFERIVRRFYQPVKAFLAKRHMSTEDCLDLNQEIFLKVYTGLDGYSWKAKFASWLFTIAANTHRNWQTSQNRRERISRASAASEDSQAASGEERESVAIDLETNQHQDLERQEQMRLLREAIEELPPKMRACVQLRLQDLDYQEIADRLGVSIGTVKPHLHAARKKLRVSLADVFEDIDF